MSENTCATNDGLATCNLSASTGTACGCSSATPQAPKASIRSQPEQPHQTLEVKGSTVRGALLLGVACLTSRAGRGSHLPIDLEVFRSKSLALPGLPVLITSGWTDQINLNQSHARVWLPPATLH